MLRTAAVLLSLLSLHSAFAAGGATAIAVMPFKDLSSARKPVGEAIRESVTSDLRDAPGVRVVERSEIDRVISEQKLQTTEIDEDPLATLRLGKLLGADVMTLGAYQQVGRRIRITARFVKVETGEVIGTAKVDGDVADFLSLQDKVTVALLKSARLAPQTVERLARRSRPKLRSLKPVELFGRASTEKDEPMKAALLKEAVKEAPEFNAAQDELSALEQKLKVLEQKAREAEAARLQEARAHYAAAKTPEERWSQVHALAGMLVMQRRYNEVLKLWQELAREVKDPRMAANVKAMEVDALYRLHRYDEAVQKGDAFASAHADAPEFGMVKNDLERIIDLRRKIDAGKKEAEKKAAEVKGERRWDLCQLGNVYQRAYQFEEAERLFLGCLAAGTSDQAEALYDLVLVTSDRGDFKSARRYLAALEETSPSRFQEVRGVETRIPADD